MIKVGKEEVGIWKEELAELGMKMNGVIGRSREGREMILVEGEREDKIHNKGCDLRNIRK